jgi:hypothetical protein
VDLKKAVVYVAINVKTAVMPVSHIVDEKIIDEALFFEQRKYFRAKSSLQIIRRFQRETSPSILPMISFNIFPATIPVIP